MKKKLIAGVLIASFILGMTGCSLSESESQSEQQTNIKSESQSEKLVT